MPTGYTAEVGDGKLTDFNTFALRCARAFGAAIMQRDDPMNDPPKHREPSDYYTKRVAELRVELARVNAMTVEDAATAMVAEWERGKSEREQWDAKNVEENNRYNAMLAQVVKWQPPTKDHVGLKDFMAEQLRISRTDYSHLDNYPPRPTDAAAWLTERRDHARSALANALESENEEAVRCAGANAWIDALYASLDKQPATA